MSWRTQCTDECCRPAYDYTETIILNRRQIKSSRKDHTCWYCGKTIPAGSKCRSEAVLYDGRVETLYKHDTSACMYGE